MISKFQCFNVEYTELSLLKKSDRVGMSRCNGQQNGCEPHSQNHESFCTVNHFAVFARRFYSVMLKEGLCSNFVKYTRPQAVPINVTVVFRSNRLLLLPRAISLMWNAYQIRMLVSYLALTAISKFTICVQCCMLLEEVWTIVKP